MGPAVMLGQDLADVAWRQVRVRSQIWQRVTGRRVTVTGKRRERDVLITSYDASPAGVAWLPCSIERATRCRCARCLGAASANTYASPPGRR
jgi:hypothetical protein